MTQPDNIVAFSAAAADILGELHRHFPAPVDIHAPTFTEALRAETGISAPVAETLEWLHAEGYLRCGVIAPPLYARVALTTQGFSALSREVALPGIPKNSLGAWLRDALKTAGHTAIQQVITQLLTP